MFKLTGSAIVLLGLALLGRAEALECDLELAHNRDGNVTLIRSNANQALISVAQNGTWTAYYNNGDAVFRLLDNGTAAKDGSEGEDFARSSRELLEKSALDGTDLSWRDSRLSLAPTRNYNYALSSFSNGTVRLVNRARRELIGLNLNGANLSHVVAQNRLATLVDDQCQLTVLPTDQLSSQTESLLRELAAPDGGEPDSDRPRPGPPGPPGPPPHWPPHHHHHHHHHPPGPPGPPPHWPPHHHHHHGPPPSWPQQPQQQQQQQWPQPPQFQAQQQTWAQPRW